MTKSEYDKILNIIDECVQTVYITPMYPKRFIPAENVQVLKDKIKELLKDKQ